MEPVFGIVVSNRKCCDYDICGIGQVHGPKSGSPQREARANADMVGTVDTNQLRSLNVVVNGPAEPFGFVFRHPVPEGLPPVVTVSIDGSGSLDRYVLLTID